jgi:hypothetical protein
MNAIRSHWLGKTPITWQFGRTSKPWQLGGTLTTLTRMNIKRRGSRRLQEHNRQEEDQEHNDHENHQNHND